MQSRTFWYSVFRIKFIDDNKSFNVCIPIDSIDDCFPIADCLTAIRYTYGDNTEGILQCAVKISQEDYIKITDNITSLEDCSCS